MRAKKPKEMHIDKLVIETSDNFILLLNAFKEKITELNVVNVFFMEDFSVLRKRLAALEKAESDRQAHEVTK